MSDQGFDFQGAPERREPKRFEPPPWERDAFEELQRQRAAEQVAAPVTERPVEQEQVSAGEEVPPKVTEPTRVGAGVVVQGGAERAEVAQATGPSDAEVAEYLAALAEQEPDARGPVTSVTVAVGLVLLPLGMVLLVWGVVALVKTGSAAGDVAAARTGAVTMMLFGAGFVASVFWLIYRLMKQRGVL